MKNFSLLIATLRNRFKVEDVPFQFRDPGVLADGDLRLRLHGTLLGDARRGIVPEYIFDMVRADSPDKPDYPATVMGRLSLRIGHTEHIEKYAGHIGYSVDPPYRGRRLAARSCLLILPLARAHGINPLWITCNPEMRRPDGPARSSVPRWWRPSRFPRAIRFTGGTRSGSAGTGWTFSPC